jgi:hypothetical protein
MLKTNPPDLAPPSPPQPLRTSAFVVYATLALLALTIPQSLVGWLQDKNSSELQEIMLKGANVLQRVSQQTGIAIPYQRARDFFLAATGKTDD